MGRRLIVLHPKLQRLLLWHLRGSGSGVRVGGARQLRQVRQPLHVAPARLYVTPPIAIHFAARGQQTEPLLETDRQPVPQVWAGRTSTFNVFFLGSSEGVGAMASGQRSPSHHLVD